MMHFCLKVDMKNCRLIVAKMVRSSRVRAKTAASLLSERAKSYNVAFRPEREGGGVHLLS